MLAIFLTMGINRLTPGAIATNKNVVNIKSLTGAFLNKHYIIATGIALVAFFMLGFLYGWSSALCFLGGTLTSLLLLNRTINNLQQAGTRAVNAAVSSPDQAMAVMLCAGSVSGLLVMSLVLLGCGLLFLAVGTPGALSLFVLGVCLPAMCYAVATEFFTLSCEHKAPEPEAGLISALLFPATTTLDLYASCTSALAGAMSIGALGMVQYGYGGVLLPLVVFAAALLALMGILLIIITRRNQGWLQTTAILAGLFTLFIVLFTLAAIKYLLPGEQLRVFLAVAAGSGAGLILFLPLCLELPLFFSKSHRDTSWKRYHLLISAPVLLLALAFSYYISGFYGVSMAALTVLLFTGMAVFIQMFERIQNHSLGLIDGIRAENEKPAELEKAYAEIAAVRDSSGKPTGYFHIGAMALAAFTLLLTFIQVARVKEMPVQSGMVLLGLVIGGILPYLFAAWMAGEDQNRAEEMHLQDDENPEDEMTGEEQTNFTLPEYRYGDFRESLLVLVLAAAIPLLTGFLLGKQTLAALLVGTVVSGILLAILRVRDYSNTANLNILIKFLLIISLAIAAPLLAAV